MPTLDAPEERLRKFKYRGKDASVSMKECLICQGECGGPVVKSPRFHYRDRKFDPWLAN